MEFRQAMRAFSKCKHMAHWMSQQSRKFPVQHPKPTDEARSNVYWNRYNHSRKLNLLCRCDPHSKNHLGRLMRNHLARHVFSEKLKDVHVACLEDEVAQVLRNLNKRDSLGSIKTILHRVDSRLPSLLHGKNSFWWNQNSLPWQKLPFEKPLAYQKSNVSDSYHLKACFDDNHMHWKSFASEVWGIFVEHGF